MTFLRSFNSNCTHLPPRGNPRTGIAKAALCLFLALPCGAEDWPAYQHDNQRSGITAEAVNPPLNTAWVYTARHPPSPAWPDPAKFDFAANNVPLRPKTTYDRAFQTVIANGLLYFGSSTDDRVYALDAATGEERWTFFTDGPVRLAPSIADGKVYAGSDDGFVYCLNAADGSLAWKCKPAKTDRWIPGNNRLISVHPVRTGVVVDKGVAYFCAGLFPEEGVYLCAVDAQTGAEIWTQVPDPAVFIQEYAAQGQTARKFAISPQGYLLASDTQLFLPTGRTSPVVVDRGTGKIVALLGCRVGEGGTYALLTKDALVSGPGRQLTSFDTATGKQIAAFPGRSLIATDTMSYLLSDTDVRGLDRVAYERMTVQRGELNAELQGLLKEIKRERKSGIGGALAEAAKRIESIKETLGNMEGREYTWTTPCGDSFAMILAGNVLFLGSDGMVTAYQVSDGKQVWNADVKGKAFGLATAQGSLYVSTDQGVIYCFSPGEPGQSGMRNAECGTGNAECGTGNAESSTLCATAAQRIAETSGVTRGYCLDIGCGDGQLALALARKLENVRIVAVDDDPARVAAARTALDRAGVYGKRVTVHQAPLDALPFTPYFANLIVSGRAASEGTFQVSKKEVERLLRPYGGVSILGDTVSRRGPLPGAGEWTHAYANPANTACSGDQLAYGAMKLQWFGLPGPRPMIDRHHRVMPPLAQDGRFFVIGDDCIIAGDAYNGTPLWQVEMPQSRRLAAQRDSSHVAVNKEYVYAAIKEACWVLDTATGNRAATFPLPQLVEGETRHWGYLATVDDLLFGSGRKEKSNYTRMDKLGDYEIQWDDFKRMVTSNYLFCMNRHTGELRWKYKNGVLIHPAIAIGGGRIYLVESHSKDAIAEPGGRVTLETLWKDGPKLVALDMLTGAPVWERDVDLSLCQHVLYLSYADGVLVATGSGNREGRAWYYLYGFDAATGTSLWQADHPNNKGGIGGDHGEQIHHPAIANDVIYAEPVAYALHTGTRVDPSGQPGEWALATREGCGTICASARALFYRDGHPSMQDLSPAAQRTKLNYISRTGCWINMIPANGLVLIPEASSGCSCPYPLQASFAYLPAAAALP